MVQLLKHQADELKATEGLNHVAYYHDMGLGKTYTGSEKMKELDALINLVVCQKSKVADWVEHFETNYKGKYGVYDLTDSRDYEWFMDEFYASMDEDRMEGVEPFVGVINYDLIWRRPELMRLSGFTLMLDESSMIQNEAAKRSRFILKMKPANVILLSGTPTGGKYERLWSQLHLLGWDISKQMYLTQFVEMRYLDGAGNRSIPVVVGYKNVPRLKRKMAIYGCRFLKTDEVMTLPEQTFTNVSVPSTREYKLFKRTRVITFYASGTTDVIQLVGSTTLTKMLYERQLCSIYNPAKLEAFKDLLESTEDRLIVFYNFKEEANQLRDVCAALKRPCSQVSGSMKDLSAYNEASNSVTLVQYQAGAMGLNLQLANKVIYYSLSLSSELFEQSKKRVHRIGQVHPCFYYVLICRGSVEERILKALEMRQDYTEKLFEKEEAE